MRETPNHDSPISYTSSIVQRIKIDIPILRQLQLWEEILILLHLCTTSCLLTGHAHTLHCLSSPIGRSSAELVGEADAINMGSGGYTIPRCQSPSSANSQLPLHLTSISITFLDFSTNPPSSTASSAVRTATSRVPCRRAVAAS